MEETAKCSFSIKTFCERNEVGRTTAYGEIAAKRLRALKLGKRTVITAENEAAWLKTLPALVPFMLLRIAVVAALSEKPAKARLASGMIDALNYVVLVPATYFGLRYLHGLLTATF